MKTDTALITDEQALVSASRNGHAIPVYDDGFGSLYIHRDSMGITGIVRAQSWEDAYSICEDEFFPEALETIEEMEKDYSTQYLSGRALWEYHTRPGALLQNWTWDMLAEKGKDAWMKRGEDVPFEGRFSEHPCFQESFGFRPNGQRAGNWENGEPKDPIGHGIYSKDLNGDSLECLTAELAERLEIELIITENE